MKHNEDGFRAKACFIAASVAIGWIIACGVSAAAAPIDSFSDGAVVYSVDPDQFPPPNVQSGLNPATVLNGMRRIRINGVQGTGTGPITATIDTSGVGTLTYDASDAVPEGHLIETFLWSAGDPNWQTVGSTFFTNLLADGSEAFAVDFLNFTLPASKPTQQFTMRVASRPGQAGSMQLAGIFTISASATPFRISLPFADASANIDFTRVTYVELFAANLRSGTVFTIDSVHTVREHQRGDFDFDNALTSQDIPAMLAALRNLNAYSTTNGLTGADLLTIGDIDESGGVDNADIQGLLNLVAGQGEGSLAAVPEPASLTLLGLGLTAAELLRRRGPGRRF